MGLPTQIVERPKVPCSAFFLNRLNVIVDPSVWNHAAFMRNFEFFNDRSQRHDDHRSIVVSCGGDEEVEDSATN